MTTRSGPARNPGPGFYVVLALVTTVMAVFVWPALSLRAAVPAWSTPETIALTGAGASVGSLSMSMKNGRAAAVWVEGGTTVRAAFRPSAGPFGASQTLDTQTGVRTPSIAVGIDGKAVAAWPGTNPGPTRSVKVADLASGDSTFGAPSTIFTSGTNQDQDWTQTAIAADGSTLIVFRGDGTFNPYTNIWSAERGAGGGAFAMTRRTGNTEGEGVKLGASPSGAAFVYFWAIAQGINHAIGGPKRSSGGTWSDQPAIVFGPTMSQSAHNVVVDGSDNAYVTFEVCCNGGTPGPNFIRVASDGTVPQGALNPDSSSFTSPAETSSPRAAVDTPGNAVMGWIRMPGNHLYIAYRPAGASAAFGTPELIASGLPSNFSGRFALAMDSLGNAVIVWKEACSGGACSLKSKMRPRGSSTTFGSELTIATGVKDDDVLALASDGGTKMAVLWRDNTSPINLKASVITTSLPDHLTITSSTADLLSGSARNITAEVRDANENVMTDSSTTVTFTKTSGAGSVTGTGDATAASGIATKGVIGATAGAVTITASAADLTSGTTTFTVTAGTATTLVYTSATTNLASAATRELTVQIRDANGNVVTTDNSTVVTFAKTDGAGSVTGLGTATAASGVASRTVTGTVAGSVTITASATDLASGTTTFSVIPGSATNLVYTSSTANLASGAERVLTVQLKDANANLVTSDSSTVVTFAQGSGPGSVSGLGTATANAGVASRTVTGGTAGSTTINASASGLTGAASTFTITFGTADRLVMVSSTADLLTGVERVLTAQIRDANGNVVTTDHSTQVTFAQTGGSGSVTGLGAATAASGIATRSVSATTSGLVTIAASASGLASGTTSFTVITTPVFADDPLSAGTFTKAIHVIELREAIDSLRLRYSLSSVSWTDASLSGAVIKAVHLTELRAALDAVYDAAQRTRPTYTDPTITAASTMIKATHIAELRAAVLSIW